MSEYWAKPSLSDEIRRALWAKLEQVQGKDIAQAIGIHPAQISRFSRGGRGLSVESLNRLAEYLGLTVNRRID